MESLLEIFIEILCAMVSFPDFNLDKKEDRGCCLIIVIFTIIGIIFYLLNK